MAQKFTPSLDKGPLPLRPIRCAHKALPDWLQAAACRARCSPAQHPVAWCWGLLLRAATSHKPCRCLSAPPLPVSPSTPAHTPPRRCGRRPCWVLPPAPYRDAARRALLDLLDGVRGRKGLVLEAEFASPLSLVAEALTLKEHGVEV